LNIEYDILIIGSGMGGLICADILGRKAIRSVCLKEQTDRGCLQTYVRDKVIFDSVHYLGGLGEGQNLLPGL
jgi:all-trans-retinol 13,14-reductase